MSGSDLESTIGFRFRNQGLLRQALIHRSFLNEQGGASPESYERLEFLGDSVLELVVSTELYHRLPHLDEGELTKIRAALVCRESLSQAARGLELGRHLLLGKGEETSGGRNRDSILAAAFEALTAATYLDQGYDQARTLVKNTLGNALEQSCLSGVPPKDPKSRFQEYLQAQGKPAPSYRVVDKSGPDHNPVFTVEALVADVVVGRGQGGKKADAERAAAADAMTRSAPETSETTN